MKLGGKAVRLAEMIRSGFIVAPGFCVTTHAYKLFMEKHGLQDRINSILSERNLSVIEDVRRTGADIRKIIMEHEISSTVQESILNGYHEFCNAYGRDGAVAVRSSATIEDLPEFSFAGQHDSMYRNRYQQSQCER